MTATVSRVPACSCDVESAHRAVVSLRTAAPRNIVGVMMIIYERERVARTGYTNMYDEVITVSSDGRPKHRNFTCQYM